MPQDPAGLLLGQVPALEVHDEEGRESHWIRLANPRGRSVRWSLGKLRFPAKPNSATFEDSTEFANRISIRTENWNRAPIAAR